MKGIQQNGADFIAKQSQEVEDVGADCLLKMPWLKSDNSGSVSTLERVMEQGPNVHSELSDSCGATGSRMHSFSFSANSKLLFSALASMWKTTCAVAGAISFDCLLYWVSVWLQYKQKHQLLFRCIPDKSSCSVRVSCTHRCSAARAPLTTWRDTSGRHVRESINFLLWYF